MSSELEIISHYVSLYEMFLQDVELIKYKKPEVYNDFVEAAERFRERIIKIIGSKNQLREVPPKI